MQNVFAETIQAALQNFYIPYKVTVECGSFYSINALPFKRPCCEHFKHVILTMVRLVMVKSPIVLHAVEGPLVAPHFVQVLSLLLIKLFLG